MCLSLCLCVFVFVCVYQSMSISLELHIQFFMHVTYACFLSSLIVLRYIGSLCLSLRPKFQTLVCDQSVRPH